MELRSTTIVYFSPTQTTRKILEAIAGGIQAGFTAQIDLTPAAAGRMQKVEVKDQLAVIGVPVYAGRVPAVAAERIGNLDACGTPAVLVVVYGNREYEDSLRELKDITTKAGFKPVAFGAFIGEHSFSSDKRPIAAGRPDKQDLAAAAEFGVKIRRIFLDAQSAGQMKSPQVPGNFPYIEYEKQTGIAPVTLNDNCTQCEKCSFVCPVDAITVKPEAVTDREKCIHCCACVRACSVGARVMMDEKINYITDWLSTNCRERKQPVTFL